MPLTRDLEAMSATSFDLVIVGGGIFGACAAWDAALRGLQVALIERSDFGGQTSANCYKMVHGGSRYMQHGDLVRVRESCRERRALLRIAPHLVQPLPIVVPTYGHGKASKALLGAGLLAYDLVTLDRNSAVPDQDRRMPWTRFLSRTEVLKAFPAVEPRGLTGAVLFHDAQMYNPPRLVLAFLRAAAAKGVQLANYVEAVGLLRANGRVLGVEAHDRRSGARFPIRARAVLNAAGPYAEPLLLRWLGRPLARPATYSRDACFVVRRRPSSAYGLAVLGRTQDADALLARGARHLFVVPWREVSLIGVWHRVWTEGPERVCLSRSELEAFLTEFNTAYPGLELGTEDIALQHAGLLPFGEPSGSSANFSYGKRSILIDHAAEHALQGLVTLIGIRYTMGRGDAAKAVDLVVRRLGRRAAPRPATERIPLFGGDLASFEAAVADLVRTDRHGLPEKILRTLAHNHGSHARSVLAYAEAEPQLAQPLPGSAVLAAEVVYAVREEMAISLGDVVYRRTDLGTAGDPGLPALRTAAELMARELGWSAEQSHGELHEVRAHFPQAAT